MRLTLLFLLAAAWLCAAEPFITPKEHGEMLYHIFDGLSCASCHGNDARGRVLNESESKRKRIIAPPLINMNAATIKKGLAKHDFGPPYHLSGSEMEALEAYLKR